MWDLIITAALITAQLNIPFQAKVENTYETYDECHKQQILRVAEVRPFVMSGEVLFICMERK